MVFTPTNLSFEVRRLLGSVKIKTGGDSEFVEKLRDIEASNPTELEKKLSEIEAESELNKGSPFIHGKKICIKTNGPPGIAVVGSWELEEGDTNYREVVEPEEYFAEELSNWWSGSGSRVSGESGAMERLRNETRIMKYYASSAKIPYLAEVEREKLLPKLEFSEGESMLDFACGPGRWSRYINSQVDEEMEEIVAIDREESLMYSLKKIESESNIRTVVGDEEELKNYENRFDKAFFNNAIGFFRDKEMILGRLKDSLKPGGNLYVSGWSRELFEDRCEELGIEYPPYIPVGGRKLYCHEPTSDELRDLLNHSGFSDVETWKVSRKKEKIPDEVLYWDEKAYGVEFESEIGLLNLGMARK